MGTQTHVLYECGICSSLHPWNWNGDCREDENRYGDEQDYAEKFNVAKFDIEVRSMDERLTADRIAD